jgi:hypothetical protein
LDNYQLLFMPTTCYDAFEKFVTAVQKAIPIQSVSDNDKEFHFQNWVGRQLAELPYKFVVPGRNSYPDFQLSEPFEGYEVKGLETPGRIGSFDSNSQAPSGEHNGRQIFYVFGLYPKDKTVFPKNAEGLRCYPLHSLIVCHGDFLSADHDYEHFNDSVKIFGTYGDVLIRDRKMYVPPTPFALTEGTIGNRTLIVPARLASDDDRFQEISRIARVEATELVTGYSFDLETNTLTTRTKPNPLAGKRHEFVAYRLKGESSEPVRMKIYIPNVEVGEAAEKNE